VLSSSCKNDLDLPDAGRINRMWTKKNSVKLSLIANRVILFLCLAFAALTPFTFFMNAFSHFGDIRLGSEPALLITIYICLIPAILLLLTLDRLLVNIKKDEVFTKQNVKYLRVISWACFVVALILFISGIFVYLPSFIVSVAAGFFGLIIRVVKNVIEAAVDLKNENDFTI